MRKTNQKVNRNVRYLGNLLTDIFHYLALFAIGSMVVWSAGIEFIHVMASKRAASIEDILLLFIYLELGAMVGIYFKTKRMPVRFLIYVAITALTRMLVGIIQADHHLVEEIPLSELPVMPLIYISAAILILAVATLVIRFGSYRYPSENLLEDSRDSDP